MNPSVTAASPNAPAPQGACRLADWGLIRAEGEDARKFLHGLLTQDVQGLQPGQARLAGLCSAKGRLLATFVLWREGPGNVLLACSSDLLAPVLKRLQMFVLRAKCKLSDATAERPLWGLAGSDALAWLGEQAPGQSWSQTSLGSADVVRLPPALWGDAEVARCLWAGPPAPDLPTLDAADWAALEVRSGVARVVAATMEQFVPQMVNLELVGGVNFQKGCYPGQEVVARSQYRGTLKRRALLVSSPTPLAPGMEIFHDADPGQPAGMVVLAAAPASGPVALVETKLATLQSGALHAGSPDGPLLQPAALPYALPTEAA